MSSLILDLKKVTARSGSKPRDGGDTSKILKRDMGTSDCPPGAEPIDISQIYALPGAIRPNKGLLNISKVHVRRESRSTGIRPGPNEDLKCLQQPEGGSVLPEPKSPMRNLSYQLTNVGEGADAPRHQDEAASDPGTPRALDEPVGQHGHRPADVLRVGKISITPTGPNEYHLLQRLDHRPSAAPR